LTSLRHLVRAAGSACLALVIGCSLLVDASDIDARCAPGQKLCDQLCVEIDDPAYGCSVTLCPPCPQLSHAIQACDGTQCIVESCEFGFGCDDCSQNLLTSEQHCGGCAVACATGSLCEDGECRPASF